MKKLITALSLIAIILIVSACNPAGGNATDNPPGTLNSGEKIATLPLNSEVGMVFEGSLEILKQNVPNGAMIQIQADSESEVQKNNIFAIGEDAHGMAGIASAKTENFITFSYDNNGVAQLDVVIETEADGTITFTFSNATATQGDLIVESSIPTESKSINITFMSFADGTKMSHVRVGEDFTWTQKAQ